jgi:hypothetical protein
MGRWGPSSWLQGRESSHLRDYQWHLENLQTGPAASIPASLYSRIEELMPCIKKRGGHCLCASRRCHGAAAQHWTCLVLGMPHRLRRQYQYQYRSLPGFSRASGIGNDLEYESHGHRGVLAGCNDISRINVYHVGFCCDDGCMLGMPR